MPGEYGFARRSRFHQDWYRREVLGFTRHGTTPLGRPLGSALHPEDAAAYANFTSASAIAALEQRRSEGWGIDPRALANMVSSQALTLNLFGPLARDLRLCSSMLRAALPSLAELNVVGVDIEWAPRRRSDYLNDMTRLDVLIRGDMAGAAITVAVEVKYTDRMSSRRLDLAANKRYQELNERRCLWLEDPGSHDPGANQLARIHALAERESERAGGPHSALWLIHHAEDKANVATFNAYSKTLAMPDYAKRSTIEAFVDSARELAADPACDGWDSVYQRYVDERASDEGFERSRDPRLKGQLGPPRPPRLPR